MKYTIIISMIPIVFAIGCSGEDSEAPNGTSLPEQIPQDSTGVLVDVSFSLQSGNSALSLTSSKPTKIDDAVSLSYAKFNIAKVRIKPDKEVSEIEKKLEEEESDAEKTQLRKHETVLEAESKEEEDPNLTKGDGTSKKSSPEMRQSKVAIIAENEETEQENLLKEETSRDPSTKWQGPFVFDALTKMLEGNTLIGKVADGSYKRIQFQLKRNYSVPEDEALFGNVLAIQGIVNINNAEIPFEISWHSALNFRITTNDAFKVDPQADNTLLVGLDASKWFEGIDWSLAERDDESGIIYINKTNNQSIMRSLRKNMKLGARAGMDKNGDGNLTEEESVGNGEETKEYTE